MKRVVIVYHTLTGGTEQMAHAAFRGACGERAVETRLIKAREAVADDVLAADAYIFGTPENLAAIAGIMKDFFDRTYYGVLDRIGGRAYGLMVCAGSDGHNAVRQVQRICTGWRLKPVAEPIIVCTHAQTPEAILAPKHIGADDLSRCEELGAAIAAGLALGIY